MFVYGFNGMQTLIFNFKSNENSLENTINEDKFNAYI